MDNHPGRYAIETIDLTKVFRKKREVVAVDNVNLKIEEGEFFGLLGPNGAGKTSLIKMLCTLLYPTRGTARVNGYDVVKEADKVRENIGWLHGETGGRALYWRLTSTDNLKFYSYMHNLPKNLASERIEALLDFFDLRGEADILVKDLSTGMRFKVMLARCLLPNPPILLLDEATVGLDAKSARDIRDLLKSLNSELGKTIILASHNLYEVEQLCHRVTIIKKGQIIADGSREDLARLIADAKSFEVEIKEPDPEKARDLLVGSGLVEGDVSVEELNHGYVLRVSVRDEEKAIPLLAEELGRGGVHLLAIRQTRPSLEEIFVKITGGGTVE